MTERSRQGRRERSASRPRTAPLPWVWCRIIRACIPLTAIQKLVWDEHRGLSKGKGATIGAGPLGLRLGVSRETIERARRDLVRFGLMRKVDLGRGRTAAWFPELPKECRPPERCRRLVDDDVQEFADRLARRISAKHGESGVNRAATPVLEVACEPRDRDATVASTVTPPSERSLAPGNDIRDAHDGTRGERGERGTQLPVSREESALGSGSNNRAADTEPRAPRERA